MADLKEFERKMKETTKRKRVMGKIKELTYSMKGNLNRN